MARAIRFTPAAWEDDLYWQGQDKKTLKRINTLIAAAVREPFAGLASPSLCWVTWPATGHAALMKPIAWCMP